MDGLERAVRSMRPGERALVRCEPRWGYGWRGYGKVLASATLFYEVRWRAETKRSSGLLMLLVSRSESSFGFELLNSWVLR